MMLVGWAGPCTSPAFAKGKSKKDKPKEVKLRASTEDATVRRIFRPRGVKCEQTFLWEGVLPTVSFKIKRVQVTIADTNKNGRFDDLGTDACLIDDLIEAEPLWFELTDPLEVDGNVVMVTFDDKGIPTHARVANPAPFRRLTRVWDDYGEWADKMGFHRVPMKHAGETKRAKAWRGLYKRFWLDDKMIKRESAFLTKTWIEHNQLRRRHGLKPLLLNPYFGAAYREAGIYLRTRTSSDRSSFWTQDTSSPAASGAGQWALSNAITVPVVDPMPSAMDRIRSRETVLSPALDQVAYTTEGGKYGTSMLVGRLPVRGTTKEKHAARPLYGPIVSPAPGMVLIHRRASHTEVNGSTWAGKGTPISVSLLGSDATAFTAAGKAECTSFTVREHKSGKHVDCVLVKPYKRPGESHWHNSSFWLAPKSVLKKKRVYHVHFVGRVQKTASAPWHPIELMWHFQTSGK